MWHLKPTGEPQKEALEIKENFDAQLQDMGKKNRASLAEATTFPLLRALGSSPPALSQ